MKRKQKRIPLILGILVIISIACGQFELGIVVDGDDDSPSTKIGPTPTTDPLSLPLSMDSDSETIRQKLLHSHTFWNSIFVDGVVTWYAPEGSGEPSQAFHQQVWVDQAAFSFRYLNGPEDGEADLFRVCNGISIMEMDLKSGATQNTPLPEFAKEPYNPPSTLSDSVYPHPFEGILGSPFTNWIFPAGFAQNHGRFTAVGMENIAGRLALVVDWFYTTSELRNHRMWVDVDTGVVLRDLDYGKGAGSDYLNSEYVAQEVIYDGGFGADLFDLTPSSLPGFSDPYGVPYTSDEPTPAPSSDPDPLGEVYFFIRDNSYPTATIKLVHLPGSCVVGVESCPSPTEVKTPFPLHFGWSPDLWQWSPDGTMAAFAYPIREDGNWAGLNIYHPESDSWETLAEFPFIDSVQWSPDGEWIAFRVQDGLGTVDIYAVRSDGTQLQNLTASEKLPLDEKPFFMEGWINNNVILRNGLPGHDGAVYLMRISDGYVKLLFEDVFFKSVMIPSPDGSFLAFPEYDPESGKSILKIITPDGSTLRELATFSTSIYPIVWSPDGEYLAFSVYGVEPVMSADVYLIKRDGRDLKQVYQGEATNFVFSPDGQHLLVEDTMQRRLFAINLSSLETTLIQAPGLPLDWTWYGVSWRRP